MGTRTVRLDDEAERTLAKLRKMTGLSISEVLKRGLLAYKATALNTAVKNPYEIFRRLELGEGGYATTPAKKAKLAVADTIRRKHNR